MHTQDDVKDTQRRAGRTRTGTSRGATPPSGVPAAFQPRSRGALTSGNVAAVQRTAGNSAAALMIQRSPAATARNSPRQTQHQPYEQSVADYLAAGGPARLYRAIRMETQLKYRQRPGESEKTDLWVPPDGNLGAGLPRMEAAKVYQTVRQWPEAHDIVAADPEGGYTVAHQVGGNNFGTQYISFTTAQETAAHYTKENYAAGPQANQDIRAHPRYVSQWAPVIEVDVTKLGGGVRLVNLGNPAIAAQTNIGENSEISSMASGDTEILLKGTIPAGAVTKVFGVEESLRKMSLEARRQLIEQDRRVGPRPAEGHPEREGWERGYRRAVPEYFDEYFQHVRDAPDAERAPSAAASRADAAGSVIRRPPKKRFPGDMASPAEASEPAVKKPKKKKKAGPLSFETMDED